MDKSGEDKIRHLVSDIKKEKDKSRKGRTGAEKQPAPVLNQSIIGDGNTQLFGGDLIVNSVCPTFAQLKTIVGVVQEVAVLETTAKNNGIASPKGINLASKDVDAAGETIWKKFVEQFGLGYKDLIPDKYEDAMGYLLEWKASLENQLAPVPQGPKPE